MSEALIAEILKLFLIFCRVGSCLMLLPGLGGERVPPTVRLYLAIALSVTMYPMVVERMPAVGRDSPLLLAGAVGSELVTGLTLGFLVRVFYVALEFVTMAMANFAGYGSVFMQALDDNSSTTPLSELVTLPALVLFFMLDLHVQVIGMLSRSYAVFSAGQWIGSIIEINLIVTALQNAFVLTLQLAAPLLIYSMAVNAVLGFLSRLVPQVPIYFVSAPFIILGGLLLLLDTNGVVVTTFTTLVSQWINEIGANG